MLKKTTLSVLAVLAGAAWVSAADFPLELRKLTYEEAMMYAGREGGFAALTAPPPVALANEPKPVSKRPLYGLLRSYGVRALHPEAGLALRLDESKGTGRGYDRLILDFNGNFDLSDDPAIEAAPAGEPDGASANVPFGPIEVPAPANEGPWRPIWYARASIGNRASTETAGAKYLGQLWIRAGSYLETTIRFRGITERIGLIDSNCNLRLGDKPAADARAFALTADPADSVVGWALGGGDSILRDRDGSGRFESDPGGTEAEMFSEVIYFGSQPYTLALGKDLKTIRVARYSGPTGELTLKNPAEIQTVTVSWEPSPGRWEALTFPAAGGRVKVPVGNHRVCSCVLARKEDDGRTLMTGVSGLFEKYPKGGVAKVAKGRRAALECGPPLELALSAEKQKRPETTAAATSETSLWVNIGAEIRGAGGERYDAFFRKTDRGGIVKPGPPAFRVLDDGSNEVAAGVFDYG